MRPLALVTSSRQALLRTAVQTSALIVLLGMIFQLVLVGVIFKNFDLYVPKIMPDDAFYYLKIAEQISTGHGSVFSNGEPTNGYHPLWMLVLVLAHTLTTPSPNVFVLETFVVSVLCNLIAAIELRFLLRSFDLSEAQSSIGVVVFLFSPWTVNLTLTGLETPIYFVLLFAFLLCVQGILNNAIAGTSGKFGLKSSGLLGLTAGLLMLARTDSIFFTIPLFVMILLKHSYRSLPFLTLSGIIATLIVLPWLIWSWSTFHTLEQSSSVAMSVLNRYALPSALDLQYWLPAINWMLWIAYWGLVLPLYPAQAHGLARGYIYLALSIVFAFVSCVAFVRYRRKQFAIPALLVVPVIISVVYYFFIRFFVQIWHMSAGFVLAIVVLTHFVPKDWSVSRPRLAVIVSAFALLTVATLGNGYFNSQAGLVEQSRAYRSESARQLVICATDAGYLGYFSRHTVVNLDGVVNNRALDYILRGRLNDYIRLQGCDDLIIEPARLKFYDRNISAAAAPEPAR